MARDYEGKHPVIQSVGTVPAIASINAIAVYDPFDGRIFHMHHEVVFEGANRPKADELVRSAMDSARRLGCKTDGLKVLHVPNFRPGQKAFRVDPEKQVLVEVPLSFRKHPRGMSGSGL